MMAVACSITHEFCISSILHFLPRGVYSGWGIVVTVLVRPSVRWLVVQGLGSLEEGASVP